MNSHALQGRPATAADIETFYPGLTCSFQAWALDMDGEPQGIIGVALLSPIRCLFSKFNEVLRPYLAHPAVLRLIKKAQAAVKASLAPVWAVAQENEPTSGKVLERLGFRHAGFLGEHVIYEYGG